MSDIIKKENPLLFSEKDIYGDGLKKEAQTDENIDENSNEDIIDIFEYENLSMEYNFRTGESALYLKKSTNHYELLYESSINNGTQSSSFYSKDSVYVLSNYDHNTGYIGELDYIPKNHFIDFINNFDMEPKNIFTKTVSNLRSIQYMVKYFVKLISDNIYYYTKDNKDIFNDYKKVFIKYTSATLLIPVFNILDNFITDIHSYISTGKFDNSVFQQRLFELQCFKDICPDSISRISSFIKSPAETDLHQLCDSIGKNIQNIDNLINLYFEEELSLPKDLSDEAKGEELC